MTKSKERRNLKLHELCLIVLLFASTFGCIKNAVGNGPATPEWYFLSAVMLECSIVVSGGALGGIFLGRSHFMTWAKATFVFTIGALALLVALAGPI